MSKSDIYVCTRHTKSLDTVKWAWDQRWPWHREIALNNTRTSNLTSQDKFWKPLHQKKPRLELRRSKILIPMESITLQLSKIPFLLHFLRLICFQAMSLALRCLSYDFVGTSLDDSLEDLGTIQVIFSALGHLIHNLHSKLPTPLSFSSEQLNQVLWMHPVLSQKLVTFSWWPSKIWWSYFCKQWSSICIIHTEKVEDI